jgi:cytochrome c oxidase subunit 3
MRHYRAYWWWMLATISCGVLFLTVKLVYEWPQKFSHFGVYLKQNALPKYEPYLGNHHATEKGLDPRVEISGHLHEVEINRADADAAEFEALLQRRHLHVAETSGDGKIIKIESPSGPDLDALLAVPGAWVPPAKPGDEAKRKPHGASVVAYELAVDPVNADPTNPVMDRPHFFYVPPTDKIAKIEQEDVERATMFLPTHSTYFATYFTITGLHGLHVLGGVLVFIYMWLPVSKRLYQRNPEHLANRVEVCGLFWHFVDLVWIFVFPLFYLL